MTASVGRSGHGASSTAEKGSRARLGAAAAIVAGIALGVLGAVLLRAERRLGAEPSSVLAAVSEAVGHRVEAQQIDISYWPPGVVAIGVNVADESPFGPGSLLRADELELRASAWALLRGRLVVDEVRLLRPSARLVRGEDGRWNTEARRPRRERRERGGAARGPQVEVEIETVRVRGGRIRYRDRALPTAAEAEVDDLNLLLTRDGGLELDFNARALGGGPESVVGSVRVPSLRPGVDVEVEVRGAALEAARVPEVLSLLQITVPFQIDLGGRLDVDLRGKVAPVWPSSSGRLELALAANDATIEAGRGWLVKPAGVPASLELELQRGDGEWWVDRAVLETPGIELTARVDALAEPPGDAGDDGAHPPLRFSADSIRAEDLSAWMPALASFAPTGSVFLEGRLAPTADGVAADFGATGGPLRLRAGAGDVALGRFAARVHAAADGLHVNAAASDARVGAISADAIEVDVSGEADAPLALFANAVAVGRDAARLDGLSVAGQIGEDRLDLPWIDVAGFGGRLVGRAAAARLGDDYVATFEPRWEDVDAAAVLRLVGVDDRVDGILSGRATLMTRARTWDAVVPALAGDLEVHLADGAIRGLHPGRALLDDLADLPGLRSAVRRRAGELVPGLAGSTASIASLYARGGIVDEELGVETLSVVGPAYRLDADGRLGFDGVVDLKGRVHLTDAARRTMLPDALLTGVVAARRGRAGTPIAIRGTYPDLEIAAGRRAARPEAPSRNVLDRLLGGGR